jgi:hypothetical protein
MRFPLSSMGAVAAMTKRFPTTSTLRMRARASSGASSVAMPVIPGGLGPMATAQMS